MQLAMLPSLVRHVKYPNRPTALKVAAVACFFLVSNTAGTAKAYSSSGGTLSMQQWSHGGNKFISIRDRKDGTIVVSPNDEKLQSATIIICHGLGDTAEGWSDVAEQLATQMPYVKFILPTAPTQPVTLNMGMAMPSWYDIVGLDERSNEECQGILQSRDRIHDILRNENSRGVPYSRMALAGFSQGGALCLYTGLSVSADHPLAGILVMSGYLAGGSTFQLTPGLEKTPILHCHGTQDPIVHYSLAHKSKDMLSMKGIQKYEIKTYPGMQHTAIQEEIEDALQFLRDILPPLEDHNRIPIKIKKPVDMSVAELKEAIYREGLNDQARHLVDKQDLITLLQSHRELR